MKFCLILLSAIVALCAAQRDCPEINRMVLPDGTEHIIRIPCKTEPPIPRPSPSRRPSPRPRPVGEFTINTYALRVINSDDGIFRGCADPLTYHLYARVIPGVRGSTITRTLSRIDWGSGRCDRDYVRRFGGFVKDNTPSDRVAVSAYVVIGIEKDDAGTSQVNREVAKQRTNLGNLLRKLESTNISPALARIALNNPQLIDSQLKIPEIKKPSDGFLGLGHDFVGFNGLLLVSGSGYSGQPSVCYRTDFPICTKRDLYKGLRVGGKVDDNIWTVYVKVDA